MRIRTFHKRLGFGLGVIGVLWASPAFAQTPVSTKLQFSGSCSKCDLSYRTMPGLSMRGSNFSGSDFSHANLSGGSLHLSNLAGASFHKAYMMRVSGEGVILQNAILRNTTLTEASLLSSDISNADLRRADLTRGNFSGSDFSGSVLKSCDAVDANFTGANFTDAKLNHGNFDGADFTSAIMVNTDFGNAVVSHSIFQGANLSKADMSDVSGLTQEQLVGACGNAKTRLPEGLILSNCPETKIQSAEAMLDLAPIKAPRQTMFYSSKQIRRPARRQNIDLAVAELDRAIAEIESTMQNLPLDNPTRERLSATRELLEKAKKE